VADCSCATPSQFVVSFIESLYARNSTLCGIIQICRRTEYIYFLIFCMVLAARVTDSREELHHRGHVVYIGHRKTTSYFYHLSFIFFRFDHDAGNFQLCRQPIIGDPACSRRKVYCCGICSDNNVNSAVL